MATFSFTGTAISPMKGTDFTHNSGSTGMGFDCTQQLTYTGASILVGATITKVTFNIQRSSSSANGTTLEGRIYNSTLSSYTASTNTVSSSTLSTSSPNGAPVEFNFTGHVLQSNDIVTVAWTGSTDSGSLNIASTTGSYPQSVGYLTGPPSGTISSFYNYSSGTVICDVEYVGSGTSTTRLPPPPLVVHF